MFVSPGHSNYSAVPQMREGGLVAIHQACGQADDNADAVLLGSYNFYFNYLLVPVRCTIVKLICAVSRPSLSVCRTVLRCRFVVGLNMTFSAPRMTLLTYFHFRIGPLPGGTR